MLAGGEQTTFEFTFRTESLKSAVVWVNEEYRTASECQ